MTTMANPVGSDSDLARRSRIGSKSGCRRYSILIYAAIGLCGLVVPWAGAQPVVIIGWSSTNPVQITTLNSYTLRSALLYDHHEMGSFDFTHSDHHGSRELNDPWFAMDKLQHVAFSFFITTGSQYGLVNKLEVRERRALPVSVGISLLAGVSKEIYDSRSRPHGYFSKRDLVADGIGIVLAAGLILL